MTETECPAEFELCLTYDEAVELDDLISEAGAEYSLMDAQPLGDVEAVANFTWQVLFLTPWELVYIALPMSVLAFYGLSIYMAFKWIQKKYS